MVRQGRSLTQAAYAKNANSIYIVWKNRLNIVNELNSIIKIKEQREARIATY